MSWSKEVEKLSIVRKRFRKDGASWLKEPDCAKGANPFQTTAALRLNYHLLAVTIQQMPSKKLSVKTLELEAR